MRFRQVSGILLALVPLMQTARAAGPRPEIAVYAAASLRDALQEMEPACEKASGVDLIFNFGASNDLSRQITAANKADVFISADESWMDNVAAAGLLDSESRRDLLSNRLVVIGGPEVKYLITSAKDLASSPAKFISLANPDAVPAGRYAKEWLESQGQWEAIVPRVLAGVDVRAALAAVEVGAADLGIVYATDAAISKKVRVLFAVPEEESPRIRYSIAAMKDRPNLSRARGVVSWLAGTEASRIFQRLGFILLPKR